MTPLLSLAYLVASILFILCLRGLSSPESARRGILLGELGMLIAVVATLVHKDIVSYEWILGGLVIGSGIGTAISLHIPMTKMPERIAFSHAFGEAGNGTRRREQVHQDQGATWSALRDRRARVRGLPRLAHVHRQQHGLRQAPGVHQRSACHVQGAEFRQHQPVLRRAGAPRRAGHPAGGAPRAPLRDVRAGTSRSGSWPCSRSAAPTCRS